MRSKDTGGTHTHGEFLSHRQRHLKPLIAATLQPVTFHAVSYSDIKLDDALISKGCCIKVPQTGSLKQQKFISHNSGSLKSEIRAGFLLLSLSLVDSPLLCNVFPLFLWVS